VADHDDRLLRPGEEVAEGADVALHDREPAFPAAFGSRRRGRTGGPCAVLLDVDAFVAADQRVVQARVDEPRDVPSRKGDVGRLTRALELARHAEVELLPPELLAESARFVSATRRQADGHADVAVQPAVRGVLALAVARKNRAPHQKRTDR
jgi:hypothetical protein